MRIKSKLPLLAGILAMSLFFSALGFGAGYYKYSSDLKKEEEQREKNQAILNSLLSSQENITNNNANESNVEVTSYGDTIGKNTELFFKTTYTQCQDVVEVMDTPTTDIIGMNESGYLEYLNSKYGNCEIETFSKDKVVVLRRENKVCPEHYLISINNGYISIYKYNEDGNKDLVEQTDISIKYLPSVDQEKLQRGIIVETLDDVYQILEDYSS